MPPQSVTSQADLCEQLARDQQIEEERFYGIMHKARDFRTPPELLLKNTLYLAYPTASEDDIMWAYKRIQRSIAAWREGADAEGNPLWISLTLPEREEEEGLAPPSVFPEGKEKVRPEEIQEKKPEDAKPKGLLPRLFGFITDLFGSQKAAATPVKKGAAAPAYNPVKRLLRLALFALFFYITYRYLKQR